MSFDDSSIPRVAAGIRGCVWVRPPLMSDPPTANTSIRQESPAEKLLTPVQFVLGVGPQRAEPLKNLGIFTARDLLFHFPTGVNDFSDLRTVPRLEADVEQSVHGFCGDCGCFAKWQDCWHKPFPPGPCRTQHSRRRDPGEMDSSRGGRFREISPKSSSRAIHNRLPRPAPTENFTSGPLV